MHEKGTKINGEAKAKAKSEVGGTPPRRKNPPAPDEALIKVATIVSSQCMPRVASSTYLNELN